MQSAAVRVLPISRYNGSVYMKRPSLIIGAIGFVVLAVFFAALVVAPQVHGERQSQPIGGQRDEHGCLPGAGYSWCERKHVCLRGWERPCDAQPQQVVAHIISVTRDAGRSIITTDIKNGDATTTDYFLDPDASIDLSAVRTGQLRVPVTATDFPQWFLSATSTHVRISFALSVEGRTVTALVAR